MLPSISVVIPVRNMVPTVGRAIDSVIAQQYPRLELVVVDGGSEDGTLDVLRKYGSRIDRLLTGADQGVYDAMNRGVASSSGKYLYFLGADDELFHGKVFREIFSQALARRSGMVYGRVMLRQRCQPLGGQFTPSMLVGENICHQAVFLRRSIFDKLGPFRTDIGPWGDWDMTVKVMTKTGIRCTFVPAVVAWFDEDGVSSRPCSYPGFEAERVARVKAYECSLRVRARERFFGYRGLLKPAGFVRRCLSR